KEKINMFFSEFLGDNVTNTRSKKVVNSRKESLWLLIDDLYNIFNGTIPLNDSLFKDVKEFNDEGLNNIFTCYNKGIQRLYTMLNEEVLQNLTIKGTDIDHLRMKKKILENLASFNETPSMDKIDAVLKSLLLLNPGYWNVRKVKEYWRHNLGPNRRKSKKNQTEMEL
ncbi:12883_t:CDS:2, partial [Entrophospora sp. SA101]